MIYQLLKRDRACMLAMAMAPVAALAALSMDGFASMLALQFPLLVLISTGMEGHSRTSPFHATLPIAGRDLFFERVLVSLMAVWLPVIGALLTVWIGHRETAGAIELMRAAPIMMLALLLPLTIGMPAASAPALVVRLVQTATLLLGVICFYTLGGAATAAIFSIATVLVMAAAWSSIPPSFELVSRTVEPAAPSPSRSAAVPSSQTPSPFPMPWKPVLRSAFWNVRFVTMFALMASQGMFTAWTFLVPMFVVSEAIDGRRRTRWLQALPLSHRALLAIALLSSVGPLLIGTVVGTIVDFVANIRPYDRALSGGPRSDSSHSLNVSLEYWRRASGPIPDIRAPWGETFRPALYTSLGVTLYNPYSIGDHTTGRFNDWQFERATAAIYGRAVSPTDYPKAKDSLSPAADRPRVQIVNLAVALFCALLLVYLTEVVNWHVLARFSTLTLTLMFATAFGPGLILMAFVFDLVPSLLMKALLVKSYMWIAQSIPNLLALTLAAIVPIVALYLLLEWQFKQSELPKWKERASALF